MPSIGPVTPVAPAHTEASHAHHPSLTHGHDLTRNDHSALPCHWVDYYEGPQTGLFTNSTTEGPGLTPTDLPVEGVADAADKVFAVIGLAKTATNATRSLEELSHIKTPQEASVAMIRKEEVVMGPDGNPVMEAETISDPRITAAMVARPLAQIDALKTVKTRALKRQKEEAIWGIVEKSLMGLVAIAGVVGAITVVAGLSAAGPLGWVVLGLATSLALVKSVHTVRARYQNPVMTKSEENRLKELQQAIDSECRNHTEVGHQVLSFRVKESDEDETTMHLACDILNVGHTSRGMAFFDEARRFAESDLEEYFAP